MANLRPYRDASGTDSGKQQRDAPVFRLVSQDLCITMWALPQAGMKRAFGASSLWKMIDRPLPKRTNSTS
jgi:hypothetical protein